LLIACAVSLVAHSAHGQSTGNDSTGTIVGIVVTKEGGVPLGYSVVSAPALNRERFTNIEGKFALADLPAGSVQLRVRHLGYSPVDLSVVVRAGQADTVRVALTHIACD
jgi:iron complex outermembrane receptor protein